MSKRKSTSVALTAMTVRVIRLTDELADTQFAYESARNRAAQSKLDLQALQRGMKRKNAKLAKLMDYMDRHQQTSIYRAEEQEVARYKAREWFRLHPEDIPEGWEEENGRVK